MLAANSKQAISERKPVNCGNSPVRCGTQISRNQSLYGKKNGYIMTNSGRKDKEMPYGMAIGIFFPEIKNNTQRI